MTVKESIENIKRLLENANPFTMPDYIYHSLKTFLKALEQKDKEIAELRIKQISSNLNNSINQKQKEDEQLQALNEGWKIELEKKDKEISELKADRVEKDKIIDLIVNTMVSDNKILALVCKHIINKTEIECKEQNLLCDDCIKQFFEKKVREENVRNYR